MKARKTILLSVIAVLLCVYIVQLVNSGRSKIKTLTLKDDFDTVTITDNGRKTILVKENGKWLVGDKKYTADESTADRMINTIKGIKILETVSRTDNAVVKERYGFDKPLTVTASKGTKTVRTFIIGKSTSTGSQTYLRIDGKNDTCLVSGSYKDIFGKTPDGIRSKKVYALDRDSITDVKVSTDGSSWEIKKSGSPAAWDLVSGADGKTEIDGTHTSTWVHSLAQLSVRSWLDEKTQLPAREPDASVSFKAANKTYTVTVYKEMEKDKDGKDTVKDYLCTCSETQYLFTLAPYMGEIFNKKLDDLKK
ncbi:MAG: DUF4340 domain-containing protein [Treponema sp.]|jgi:hypothetical protein|nr:DUF4340 domain-containing protein [Treponema sp.]